jgi:hypothetical protein
VNERNRHTGRSRRRGGLHPVAIPPDERSVAFSLDLARADLYRLLDALARAPAEIHGKLVLEFELAWREFKRATAPRNRPR